MPQASLAAQHELLASEKVDLEDRNLWNEHPAIGPIL